MKLHINNSTGEAVFKACIRQQKNTVRYTGPTASELGMKNQYSAVLYSTVLYINVSVVTVVVI